MDYGRLISKTVHRVDNAKRMQLPNRFDDIRDFSILNHTLAHETQICFGTGPPHTIVSIPNFSISYIRPF